MADLAGPHFTPASLRLTGVYGDLRPNKWDALLQDYLAGKPITPRAGTEVHGDDVASGVRLMLEREPERVSGQSFNLSDLLVDIRDVLAHLGERAEPLLPPASTASLNVMATDKIEALGWRPGGDPLFVRTMTALAAQFSEPT